jgi:hypothetical protein
MRRAQRDVYLEGCWPEGVPLPQGRRVSEFLLVVSADGLLRRVAHHGPPLHPVFDACAVARIGNLTLDPHGAGQTILGVTVSEDGRPAPAIRRGRGGPRQAVVVRFSGSWPIGESGDPSRAILVGSELRRRIDLAPCWPARDPLPTENRGLGLTLDVADDGRISSVRASMADRYPAFTRCVLERLTGLTLESEHVAGRSGISVALDAAH